MAGVRVHESGVIEAKELEKRAPGLPELPSITQ
jgi:hypothetical protein